MKLQLINDVNTLKSTDNATQIELAVVDEQQQFIDLSQFKDIAVKVGANGVLYLTETPVLDLETNTFSFALSHNLPTGTYQIQVHLITQDDKVHIAPNSGSQMLKIEKSFNEVSGENIAVISIQQLLDDMASTLSVAEAANEKVNDAVAKSESAISTANIATTDAATAVTIANEAKSESATANENATGAVSTANDAKAVAGDAKEIADDANTKSTQAKTDASSAVQIANAASDNATQAVNTANDAKSLATDADSKSDSAVATANDAIDKSSTAVDTANTASDTADNALTIAQQADATANNADAKATDAVTTANGTIAIANDANDKADDAVAKATSAKNTAESVRAEFDALTAGNTEGELIAARTDESGTTHETLKSRIDSEATKRSNADTTTLQNAKDYTDAQIGDIDLTPYATKNETADALASAKDYVDGKVGDIDFSGLSTKKETATAVQGAKDYADTKDVETLQSAKNYTDGKIGTIDFSTLATKTELNNKVDKVSGKGLSTNDYTTAEKTKLSGISEGANNYSLPNATASILGGVKVGTNISVSSGTISVANASTSTKGVVQLNDTLTSTSTTLAATANSVKKVNDNIGDKTTLLTNNKESLVGAINELVKTKVNKPVYGVKIDTTNSNPETALTYIDDATGFTPAKMNSATFSYGSWQNIYPFNQIKPCLFKGGQVVGYLNPNDYSKFADGSDADITSGDSGDVMIEFPKIYWKFETIGTDLYIRYSKEDVDEDYKCLAHQRGTIEKDKCYVSAYLGYEQDSKLRSLSGKTPTGNKTIGVFRTLAKANGANYDQMAYYQVLMLQVLYLVMFKNRDSQTALGRGYVDGNSATITTGNTNAKGLFFGETTGKQQVKCFGIEDFYGNLFYWLDGIVADSSRKILLANENFNDTGSGYLTSIASGFTSDSGGYISQVQGTTESGFIVKTASGSTTTYYADSGYIYTSKICRFGGSWSYASDAGAFCLQMVRAASDSAASIGARLLFC